MRDGACGTGLFRAIVDPGEEATLGLQSTMSSLVLQLQGECLDSSASTLEILRKALVVARKLGVKDFQAWIEKELKGYDDFANIPSYRKLRGQLRAFNPYVGWIPIIM